MRDERTDSLRYSVSEEATDRQRRGDGVLVDDDVDGQEEEAIRRERGEGALEKERHDHHRCTQALLSLSLVLLLLLLCTRLCGLRD